MSPPDAALHPPEEPGDFSPPAPDEVPPPTPPVPAPPVPAPPVPASPVVVPLELALPELPPSLPLVTQPPAWQTWPDMQGVGVPQVWQPPVFWPVQARSDPLWHSVAPGSQSSAHAGDWQTPFAQVCPAGHAVAGDHAVQGAVP